MELNYLTKTKDFEENGVQCQIIVKYGFNTQINDCICFSMTTEIWQQKILEKDGFLPKEIAKHFPELEPLIRFDMWSSIREIPIFYMENGIHWWKLWQGQKEWSTKKTTEEYYKILCNDICLLPNEEIPKDEKEFVTWMKKRIPKIQEVFDKTMKEFGLIEEK